MKNNILYISTYCSDNVFNYLQESSFHNSGHSIQKFHKLILNGLAKNEINNIVALSSIPVTTKSHPRYLWSLDKESFKGFALRYIPFLNFLFFKNIIEFIYTFLFVLFYRERKLSIIVDCLKLTSAFGAFLASKIRKFNIVCIVTDMPGINVNQNNWNEKLKTFIIKSFINSYDGYILSSKFMNFDINKNNKPYAVIEGLVDYLIPERKKFSKNKIILYSGGLYSEYGVKDLIDAFMKLKDNTLRLHLYGYGELYDLREKYSKLDNRIIFFGTVINSKMIKKQQTATLLVNPRYSNTLIAKYCFPGKNIEYMASGTPFLGTLLPAIPDEYHQYMYHIKHETVDGLYNNLSTIIKKSTEELKLFGIEAQKFIIKNKNYEVQASKIIKLIEKLNHQ